MKLRKGFNSSPWGAVQYVYHVGHNIYVVSTASHGGMYVPPEYNKLIPAYMRAENGWYEEDSSIAVPCFILGAAYFFQPHSVRFILSGEAERTVREWYPYEYERYTGRILKPGESHSKDEQEYLKAHANDWIVISAIGDYHPRVPVNYVGVWATMGGSRLPNSPCKCFLVPASEYKNREIFKGFIVDPVRHTAIQSL
jgi:hypothetical protein